MDSESKLYSMYKNILLMDIGSDSGKVSLELSRELPAWSSVVCKERKHKKGKVLLESQGTSKLFSEIIKRKIAKYYLSKCF